MLVSEDIVLRDHKFPQTSDFPYVYELDREFPLTSDFLYIYKFFYVSKISKTRAQIQYNLLILLQHLKLYPTDCSIIFFYSGKSYAS
jgi:hypothetical protein